MEDFVLSAGFNNDFSLIQVGHQRGYTIYRSYPFKKTFD